MPLPHTVGGLTVGKDVKIRFQGKGYSLLFNGAAMFAAQELFGEESLSDAIFEGGAEAWGKVCRLLEILIEQGELARRFYGHTEQPLLAAEEIRLMAGPLEITHLRQAATDAIMKGYGREVENEDEIIDVGLLKHQKKSG